MPDMEGDTFASSHSYFRGNDIFPNILHRERMSKTASGEFITTAWCTDQLEIQAAASKITNLSAINLSAVVVHLQFRSEFTETLPIKAHHV